MIGAVEAREIVEAPPGLGGCDGLRRRIETSNRFEVLIRKGDDWKLIPGRRARGTKGVDVGAVDDQSPKTGMSRGFLLASAAKVVEAGNRISMGPNPGDNYIEDGNTGERIGLRVERRTYVFDVEYRGIPWRRTGHDNLGLGSEGSTSSQRSCRKRIQRSLETQGSPRDCCARQHHREGGHKIIQFHGRELGLTRPA